MCYRTPMSKVQELVGTNVRDLRVAAGVTQGELAGAMSKSGFRWHQATVAEIEHARRQLTFEELPVVAAYFEMPLKALLIAPGSSLPVPATEVVSGEKTYTLSEWLTWVTGSFGDGWKVLEGPAPAAARRAIDVMMSGVDRPWATAWRRQKGGAIPAYRLAREQALANRTKFPGPAYLVLQGGSMGYTIPPWGESENTIDLKKGDVYVARDENERDKLAEIAEARNPAVRRITPQEAYRRRHR